MVDGINPDGTLFDSATGSKLSYDSDVSINKEYYLLKRGSISNSTYSTITIQKILQKEFLWDKWTLYEVCASSYNEGAARFFLEYHYRLTDHSVSLQPIWPLYIENSYMIKHNHSSMYVIVEGNASNIASYPDLQIEKQNFNSSHAKLYKIACSDRQQLITIERSKVLKYTYFWKEPLICAAQTPHVSVTDCFGNIVALGDKNTLPPNNILSIETDYDGELIISKGGAIVHKQKISACKITTTNIISYGCAVEISIGFDIVWRACYKKESLSMISNANDVAMQISSASVCMILTPHSLHNMLLEFNNYPVLCKWICISVKRGRINKYAYRRLQELYRTIKSSKEIHNEQH